MPETCDECGEELTLAELNAGQETCDRCLKEQP